MQRPKYTHLQTLLNKHIKYFKLFGVYIRMRSPNAKKQSKNVLGYVHTRTTIPKDASNKQTSRDRGNRPRHTVVFTLVHN